MLAADNRLRKARDISAVYKRGAYGGVGDLSVKALPTPAAKSPRVVVVVGKKVDKRAVVRNRIRRRTLGVVARIWASLAPCDIVITIHTDISALGAARLRELLETALRRAKVMGHKE